MGWQIPKCQAIESGPNEMTLVIGHVPVPSGERSMGDGELAGISFFEIIYHKLLTPLCGVVGA